MGALLDAELVLTTISEVHKSFNTKKDGKKALGHLHQVKYFRVVLDEAHSIRNEKSPVSLACRAIDAKHHWALTGTPLINSVFDLFAILGFLGHPLGKNKNTFKKAAAGNAVELLEQGLKECTIKRNYATLLFGSRLVNLPKMQCKRLFASLSGLEAKVYSIIHKRFARMARDFAKGGGNNTLLASLQTRPRQMVSHPIMLQRILCDLLGDDTDRFLAILDPEQYDDENDKSLAEILGRLTRESLADRDTVSPDNAMTKQDKSSKTDSRQRPSGAQRCSACKKLACEPCITSCFHVYCQNCLKEIYESCEAASIPACCKVCDETIDADEPFVESDTEVESDETLSKEVRRSLTLQEGTKPSEMKLSDWKDKHGRIWRTAKLVALADYTRSFLDENSKGKIIWFTQWVGFAKVLAAVCEEEGWGCVQYLGSMLPKAKNVAIEKFNDPACNKRVLNASLKAGGVGLNLTVASKVILLDHW